MSSHDHLAAVSRRRLLIAGALDQFAVLGVFLFCFGLGLLYADTSAGSSNAIGAGLGAGILGAIVCLFAEAWLATRHGSTAGLFIFGIRFDPREEVHWYEDAFDWLLFYWQSLILGSVAWLLSKVNRKPSSDDGETGFVRDPRARRAGARVVRGALVILLVVGLLPLVLAVRA